jgi:hypothetical protein
LTHNRNKPWWWTGSPEAARLQVICWSVFALAGLGQVALHRLEMSEPVVWMGGVQLLGGSWLAASAFRSLRAIQRGDTAGE